MKRKFVTLFALFCLVKIFAQTTISGSVFDIYLEPVSSIKITHKKTSTTTDSDGFFTFKVKQKLPVVIEVSGVGYQTQTVEVTDTDEISVVLEKQSKLQEVVVSASRTPERILESPVTIERVGAKELHRITSLNFYENLVNLKDVDVLTSGYNVKSINTRAFASIDNVRFVQLVDGADTTNPSYNFSLGNTMGLNDLDVASVEVLPGAASALYGANAFNGILVMNSKNPFEYKGVSASFKTGFTNQEVVGSEFFSDTSIRMAFKLSDKFAMKFNFNHSRAHEWIANDTRNITGLGGVIIPGTRANEDYDGLNVYGDELSISVIDAVRVLENTPGSGVPADVSQYIPPFRVTRDGFSEMSLLGSNEDVKMLTFDGSIYYRPTGNDDVELIFNSKYGYGNNTYVRGNARIIQTGALNQQHKFDIKLKNYLTARGYYSNFNQRNDSYNTLLLGTAMNTAIKNTEVWFTEYLGAFANSYLGKLLSGEIPDLVFSQETARTFANIGKPEEGTTEFERYLNIAKQSYVSEGGAKLKNNSSLYHTDLNLNLTDFIKTFGLQLGGAYRKYKIDSGGELYTDVNAPIEYNEFGIYTQATVKSSDKRLSLSGSLRYDKSQNFKGNLSPRLSLTYAAGENKNHNFRISYQTAFRNPTSEDQYAGYGIGSRVTAIGNIEENYPRYTSTDNLLSQYSPGIDLLGSETVDITGEYIYNNSYTLESELAFTQALNEDIDNGTDSQTAYADNAYLLEKAEIEYLEPERIRTVEFGYRGEFDFAKSIFEVDFNTYYSRFNNFIKSEIISTPFYGDVTSTTDINSALALVYYDYARYTVRVNTSEIIDFYGAGISIATKVFNDFNLSGNYVYTRLKDEEEVQNTLAPGFNTPKHRIKLSFGKDRLFKNLGFNINARWQNEFLWQSAFLNGDVDARTVIDAQLNLRVPKWKSNFKLGGTNITGKEYVEAPGLGSIGSVYYLNWTINN